MKNNPQNVLLLICYFASITVANSLLTVSAHANGLTYFLLFQIAGNLVGFLGILAYTGLLRTLPLHVAFPLSRGTAVIGVQLIAALLVFHEVFKPTEIAGTVVVAAGVILVGASQSTEKKKA
jgi:multidrug transporter EmrE-like cation transporter